MKRFFLIVALVVALVALVGCGLFGTSDSTTETVSAQTQKTQEKKDNVKMIVPKGIPVLMYHKVGPDVDNDAVISEELFRKQMKFLKDEGYHPLTMEQLYEYVTKGTAVPEKPVVLNFDDGYADTYSIVYPIMKEYGFPATMFINASDARNA